VSIELLPCRNKVYLADIESAVRYALTMEVSAVKVIEGKKLEALRSFIGAFKQVLCSPSASRPSVYLQQLHICLLAIAVYSRVCNPVLFCLICSRTTMISYYR